MMTCDPCQFCIHLYDDSDPSVGLYGYGCSYQDDGGEEWEPGQGVPCPGFVSFHPTRTLENELITESLEELYGEECE